ncbi:MAG: response regulator [Sedimentisphaerales bacterium]|nr:response regulator [Sedimentisphaerales bacterium]MBN2841966.1 response regulator [Sedimentisphaerales bacterium]
MRSLIIEDNAINRKYLLNLLKVYGPVEMAENGLIGVDLFGENLDQGQLFDLICLDVMMPEMDGQETLKRIRQLEASHGIFGLDGVKVIMTTAMDDKKTILQAFKTGCESFLIKPIDKNALVQALKNLELLTDAGIAK